MRHCVSHRLRAGADYPADPAWGTAFPQVAWTLWKWYGDTRAPAQYYDNLRAYMDFMQGQVNSTGLGNLYSYYGDWCPPPAVPGTGQGPKPPGSLVSSVAYIGDVQRMIDIAGAVANQSEVQHFTDLYAALIAEYNAAFLNTSSYVYGNADAQGLQTAHASSIAIGAPPPAAAAPVFANLVNNIAANGGAWSTGITGMKYLTRVLIDGGADDVAVDMLLQTTYPSYGFMFNNDMEPATTLWELPDAPYEGPSMNSR